MSPAARALVGLVRAYQWLVSPLLPSACRYDPTCSRYAAEAIRRFGAVRGAALAARRVGRCHPWGGHGYDPVPENPKREKQGSRIGPEGGRAPNAGLRSSPFPLPLWGRRKVAAAPKREWRRKVAAGESETGAEAAR